MATTWQQIDLKSLDYSHEILTNKYTGAKTVNVSTEPGSKDREHRIRFQLGSIEEPLRAPFGVSKPKENQENTSRRDLDLSIDNDDLLDFLRKLDASNLDAAVERSTDWFKKEIAKPVLADRFKPIVKEPNRAEYRPTAHTKMVVDAERNNTQIFLVSKETPAGPDGPARIDEYEPITFRDIPKGAKVMAVVETNGLWLGSNQFGMSLNVSGDPAQTPQDSPFLRADQMLYCVCVCVCDR